MAAADSNRFWSLVAATRKRMLDASPEGYEPVVEVFLNGRSDPLRLGTVATYPSVSPWKLLVEHDPDDPGTGVGPDDLAVFVRDELVLRVEVRLERSEEARVGFAYEVRAEPD